MWYDLLPHPKGWGFLNDVALDVQCKILSMTKRPKGRGIKPSQNLRSKFCIKKHVYTLKICQIFMFRVFRTDWYEKKLKKLSPYEQKTVIKIEQELKQSPYSGKPLGYEFFREKKI